MTSPSSIRISKSSNLAETVSPHNLTGEGQESGIREEL